MRTPEFMDHFENPRNAGEMEDPDAVAEVTNPVCGDEMRLYIRVEGGRISDARFKTYGCAAALAASSVVTEMIKGKTLEEARAVTGEEVSQALGGLPPHKAHAGDLVQDAVQAVLQNLSRRTQALGNGGERVSP